MSHAMQLPLHAVPQQYPSTQNPVTHSAAPVHGSPCAFMRVVVLLVAVTVVVVVVVVVDGGATGAQRSFGLLG